MLDENSRWQVLFTKAFLLLFVAVGIVAAVAGAVQREWASLPVGTLMAATAGLLWIAFFPSRRSIHPGQYIGGGLRLARVNIEPGEIVAQSCMAGYAFGARGVARLRRLMNSLVGEAFLTDRRLIFSPYHISMRFRPTWIALTDIASISERGMPLLNSYGFRAIVDVKVHDGSTAVFWLRDQGLLEQLRVVLQQDRVPADSTSNLTSPEEPGLFAFIWSWGVTAGFIIMVLATEGTSGFRILPLGLMAAAMSLLAALNTLRAIARLLKARRHRASPGTLGRA